MKYPQGSNQDLGIAPKTESEVYNKWKPYLKKRKWMEITKSKQGLTIPIKFSRQSTTELLVAAEQIASFLPWNQERVGITFLIRKKKHTKVAF